MSPPFTTQFRRHEKERNGKQKKWNGMYHLLSRINISFVPPTSCHLLLFISIRNVIEYFVSFNFDSIFCFIQFYWLIHLVRHKHTQGTGMVDMHVAYTAETTRRANERLARKKIAAAWNKVVKRSVPVLLSHFIFAIPSNNINIFCSFSQFQWQRDYVSVSLLSSHFSVA